ncbi:MAG: EAL domain-containing protein [Gammaproteobacteria bacterium]|nr:EAL domain-containing protein [Gammaproteobacteria bacterium]
MDATAHGPEATPLRYAGLLDEIERLQRTSTMGSTALLLVELAGLGAVNERFGYGGGDRVVEHFAERLRAIARTHDRSIEIDSRTFALLIHQALHAGHALLAADKVGRAAREAVSIGTGRACVKAHIGIGLLPGTAEAGEELLRQCEVALESARSRDEPHVLYAPSLPGAARAQAAHSWFDVEEALEAGEFELFYQPKVALVTGQLVGAEALVRWNKPGTGWVPPGQFLPAIEQSRGIRALLWFVLNAGLRQAAAWSQRQPGFGLAINLAAGNFDDGDLADLVTEALGVWSLPAAQLTLELTESSLMQDPAHSLCMLRRLRDIGLRTSIDDFGTGYSSLAYLRDLPADELKVDRAFVSRITASTRDRDIVASIVQLAHAVGLKVVAEGIEDPATLAALTAMGCDIGQGFHFAAPLPAPAFETGWIGMAAMTRELSS